MRIWTAWIGEMPPYIKYCIETIEHRSGFHVDVIDEKNVDKFLVGCGLSKRVWELERPAQIIDCIRIAILNRYGGLWMDADTVCLSRLDEIFELASAYYFSCVEDNLTGLPYNGYMLARAGNSITSIWLHKINKVLDGMSDVKTISVAFHKFGSDMLRDVRENIPHYCMPMYWFFPFNFSNGNGKIFNSDTKINDYIQAETKCIALSNSWISSLRKDLYEAPIDIISDSNCLLGSIFKYSLGVSQWN